MFFFISKIGETESAIHEEIDFESIDDAVIHFGKLCRVLDLTVELWGEKGYTKLNDLFLTNPVY
jgi:hypothetical protein